MQNSKAVKYWLKKYRGQSFIRTYAGILANVFLLLKFVGLNSVLQVNSYFFFLIHMILEGDVTLAEIITSLQISADRNFWLAKVAGHIYRKKKLGQFSILGLETA